MDFFSVLDQRAERVNSLLCVGLDPHSELLPEPNADAARDFCFRLIDATAAVALAFKPNSAFFEVFGSAGFTALKDVIAHVPDGIPVILDAKRGDIASTAEAYARAAFYELGATAITLSPYLGRDVIEPFIRQPDKGVFILCKTSNPGADEIQNLQVGERPLYEIIADRALSWSQYDNVGLVVGATDIEALGRVREVSDAWFLVPGVGAQGGDLEAALSAGLGDAHAGLLINVSRSIGKAADPRAEAIRLRDKINDLREKVRANRGNFGPVDSLIDNLARALAQAGCAKFGHFTLKSGKVSPIYLDLRRLVSFPDALRTVASAVNQLLRHLEFDHIAAIPYAALPIGTAVSLLSGRSLIYPRREVKDYGTKADIEGVYQPGETAVLLDDLATTGETKFETVNRLRAAGLVVKDIVVVIDREQGAKQTIEAEGYRFHAVATLRQLLDAWQRQGVLGADQRREVDAYLAAET
jgi:uridine monophosphate synthetase